MLSILMPVYNERDTLRAVVERGEVPAADAFDHAARFAFEGRHRLDARDAHVEDDAIRQHALPRIAMERADSARWDEVDT